MASTITPSPAVGASTSAQSRSPAPVGGVPTRCRRAGRTGSGTAPGGPGSEGGLGNESAVPSSTAVRSGRRGRPVRSTVKSGFLGVPETATWAGQDPRSLKVLLLGGQRLATPLPGLSSFSAWRRRSPTLRSRSSPLARAARQATAVRACGAPPRVPSPPWPWRTQQPAPGRQPGPSPCVREGRAGAPRRNSASGGGRR